MTEKSQSSPNSGRISRVVTAAGVGVTVTVGLLFLMQFLIDMGEEVYTDVPVFDLEFGVTPPEPAAEKQEEPVPERPPEPEPMPRITVFPDALDEPMTLVRHIPEVPQNYNAFANGPAVNIYKAKAEYPVPALMRKIEGQVVIQFDVLSNGKVDNVIVLESSNELFNEAAVEAVRKFRFKPRVVDGVSHDTRGMKNMFQFEIRRPGLSQ